MKINRKFLVLAHICIFHAQHGPHGINHLFALYVADCVRSLLLVIVIVIERCKKEKPKILLEVGVMSVVYNVLSAYPDELKRKSISIADGAF